MVRRALKPTGAMWTFTNWRSLPVVMKAASDLGWPVTSVLVWDKDWIGPGPFCQDRVRHPSDRNS